MKCPNCSGEKKIAVFPKIGRDGKLIYTIPCSRCDEMGNVPDIQAQWIKDGKTLRQARLARRMTLREESLRLGIDVMEFSNAERGITDPKLFPTWK